MGQSPDPTPETIDWRMVLQNEHLGWSEDAIREATALRDAELGADDVCPTCGQRLSEERRR
ncbi:hypothetical protein [Paracoccus sp. KR1-242]|uniref:hypothetical protein n=1 Tax=Paracoccus sp. KR1-242 TaxID=3410028 RepID=UPI003BFD453A